MRNKIILVIVLIPLFSLAQNQHNGLKWTDDITWEQIKARAKAEKKYIFVDCFTTWCGPCKQMDKQVYVDDSVCNYMNAGFVSVKIQMDTSKNDNEKVQKWYQEAANIKQQFKISAFPTFLFFSPSGEIVHKDMGFKKSADFISLAKRAIDPNQQFYSFIRKYKSGEIKFPEMPSLARWAKNLYELELSDSIGINYIENYLLNLSLPSLLNPDTIEFMRSYANRMSSKSKVFYFFYKQSIKIDSVMNNIFYAENVIDNIIMKEEIKSTLNEAKISKKAPVWKSVAQKIKDKYGKNIAERNILNAKITWYRYIKNWPDYIQLSIQKIKKYGLDTESLGWANTNNVLWSIFEHGNKKNELMKVLKWAKIIYTYHSDYPFIIDTYANLLYKLGRKAEAISLEEKAEKIENENAFQQKAKPLAIYTENLEKMRKGQGTWMGD
jgi:thioredoxin-related protein